MGSQFPNSGKLPIILTHSEFDIIKFKRKEREHKGFEFIDFIIVFCYIYYFVFPKKILFNFLCLMNSELKSDSYKVIETSEENKQKHLFPDSKSKS